MNSENNFRRFKMVTLGEYAVGKTTLSLRFVKGNFEETCPTIGAAYLTKKVEIDDIYYNFEMWDCSGQSRFSAIVPLYYRSAEAVMIVFDVSDPVSFEKVIFWHEELRKHLEHISEIPIVLVANKMDLLDKDDKTGEYEYRQILEDAENYAEDNGLGFFKVSAKTGEQVYDAYEWLARHLPKIEDIENSSNSTRIIQDLEQRRTVNVFEDLKPVHDSCC